jgi:hypothetical protein
MFKKIISGGQIGAEQAALDVAIKLDIPHGGWIQKGRGAQRLTLPEKYQLDEMPTASFKKRIEKNVMGSDGTLIISHGELTGASDYSQKMTDKHNCPSLHIDLNKIPAFIAALKMNAWVVENNIEILNVAGPKTSEDPNIYKATMDILESAYYLSQVEDKPLSLDVTHKAFSWDRKPVLMSYPKTVDEAVDRLTSELPLKDKTTIANMNTEEVDSLNDTLGRYVIDSFGLWTGNKELVMSCRLESKNDVYNENAASMVIINRLWKKLRKTHKLRIVKS